MTQPEPQKSMTAQEVVYASVRKMLMNGDLACGQRLIVRDLAESFGTSTMPVREALRRLVAENALEDSANRGVIVPEITMEAVTDLTRIRCVIEGQAVEWAAATISGRELAECVRKNDAMQIQTEKRSHVSYLHLNREFHFDIYRAARSPALMQIIDRLWLRAGPWLTIKRQDDDEPFFGVEYHLDLLTALHAGDGAAARQALVADIAVAGGNILRWVESRRETLARGAKEGAE
ncbi:GntR family transcriptional regulator [Rhodobacteraceae bacterium F11138]|nr:GntR family transcriptional regulator [Rhodobacteraceae bacterium F11138]